MMGPLAAFLCGRKIRRLHTRNAKAELTAESNRELAILHLASLWVRQTTGMARSEHREQTPEDKDRRRICRERKVLIMERVQHVNRIKGLLFSQGASAYEPLRRDRRPRLGALPTGDGPRPPPHPKTPGCLERAPVRLFPPPDQGM